MNRIPNTMKDDQYEDDDIEYVSKSELKRDAERLKVMGKERDGLVRG